MKMALITLFIIPFKLGMMVEILHELWNIFSLAKFWVYLVTVY